MTCSSMAALDVVNLTTPGEASGENLVNMLTFLFECFTISFMNKVLLYYPEIILYMRQANERRRLAVYTKWAMPYGMMDLGQHWFR